MVRALRIIFVAAACAALGGCMNCPRFNEHPTIKSRTGETLCARHHIPLVTVSGYQRRHVAVLYHTYYMQLVVETCNPNCVLPYQSLVRTKEFPVRSRVTYCTKCEQVVAAHRALPNPQRKPTLLEQMVTGVYIPD